MCFEWQKIKAIITIAERYNVLAPTMSAVRIRGLHTTAGRAAVAQRLANGLE